jgi:hypothetical protein
MAAVTSEPRPEDVRLTSREAPAADPRIGSLIHQTEEAAMRLKRFLVAMIGATALVLATTSPVFGDTARPKPKLSVLSPGAKVLEVASSGEFAWTQGDPPVRMGPVGTQTCFLTGVTGDFEGAGESVHAYIAADSWYLGGSSQQRWVAAFARCVPVSGSGEYFWSQGELAKPMGGDADKACFLTYVSGHFEGGGEWVNTFTTGGSWYLGGNSLQDGVAAGARCIPVSSYTGEFGWGQGQTPEPMVPNSDSSCFLTLMTGRFKGGGELVRVFEYRGWWFLGGSSLQEGVADRARCI